MLNPRPQQGKVSSDHTVRTQIGSTLHRNVHEPPRRGSAVSFKELRIMWIQSPPQAKKYRDRDVLSK
jgi:hypothetical protein